MTNAETGSPDPPLCGAWKRGVEHPQARFSEDDIRKIRAAHEQGGRIGTLARFYKCAPQSIRAIVLRQTWKHIE